MDHDLPKLPIFSLPKFSCVRQYIMNIPDVTAEDEIGAVTEVDITVTVVVVSNITEVVLLNTTRQ